MSCSRHCFVVASYGRSPYLEACLESLRGQSLPSSVVISTSTPFEGIEGLAREYGAVLRIHGPNRGIGADWNAALEAAEGDLVTIAHQDDVYAPAFTERVMEAHARMPGSAISFCDFEEIGPAGVLCTRNHRVKRLLVAMACAGADVIAGGIRRRLLLGFGNPILCPSVTINRALAPAFAFREDLRTNMDWLAWIELSAAAPVRRIRGVLVHRRVHKDSETARCIVDGARLKEDRLVFDRLWLPPISWLIALAYRLSYPGYFK